MKNPLEKFEYKLSRLGSTSFRFRPKTIETVEIGSSIVSIFELLSDDDRALAREMVDSKLSMKLLALGDLMAETAVRLESKDLIRNAIGVHIVENMVADYREKICDLVLVNYAAERLGVDIHEIFSSFLPIASSQVKDFFADFFNRDPSLNRLQSFNMKAEDGPGEFRFVSLSE